MERRRLRKSPLGSLIFNKISPHSLRLQKRSRNHISKISPHSPGNTISQSNSFHNRGSALLQQREKIKNIKEKHTCPRHKTNQTIQNPFLSGMEMVRTVPDLLKQQTLRSPAICLSGNKQKKIYKNSSKLLKLPDKKNIRERNIPTDRTKKMV